MKFAITVIVGYFQFYVALCESNNIIPEQDVCGKIFSQDKFVLTTPKYPETYPPNQECWILLKGSNPSTQFRFEFLDFDLEESLGCVKDRLEVGNQDALCSTKTKFKNYFAENGSLQLKFVSDGSGSKRGFKIRVQRLDCEENVSKPINQQDYTTTEIQYEWTSQTYTPAPTPTLNHCCSKNYYNSKRFLLVSPGFPYSINSPNDCVFVILKENENICRVRIHVLFFWLGQPTYNSCPYGFLEIDGKFICGCNSELKLTTTFDGTNRKIMRFRTNGYKVNSYSGFVLEVIQDECPKRYEPSDENSIKTNNAFRFYKDHSNVITWPKYPYADVERLHLINESHTFQNNYGNRLGFQEPRVFQHVYIFGPAESSVPTIPKEKEETNYIETSKIKTLLTNLYDYNNCLYWNRLQFNLLNNRFGRNLLQTCTVNQNLGVLENENHCVNLNYRNGYLRSPNYPFNYPKNLNLCYRIKKIPGHCELSLHFMDFFLEDSPNCVKDYVILHNNFYRYCGKYLSNTLSKIDINYKEYIEIRFVTDQYNCGKGFYATYQQIPCKTDPDSTPRFDFSPEITTTMATPVFVPCDYSFQERSFVISKSSEHKKCTYRIKKYAENVCKIQLYFEIFDISCSRETLLVDDSPYCGNLTGTVVTLEMPKDVATIVYLEADPGSPEYLQGQFVIRGKQLTKCLYPEVPAERIFATTSNETKQKERP